MVDLKEQILSLLKKHPEGLMIKEISKYIKRTRQTTIKYIHELKGEGKVNIRQVSKAKLIYLVK